MRGWLLFVLLGALMTVTRAAAAFAPKPGDYRFGAGDVIEVTVSPQQSFSRIVTVQPDGKVSYPHVGQIRAAGLTVDEFAGQLRGGLERDLVDPQVTVSLKELGKQSVGRVSVLGQVRSPGTFEVREGTTLPEMLASAGGPGPTADLGRVIITRLDQSMRVVDLTLTEETGRLMQSVTLQPGDLIVVPEGTRRTVLVLGEVARPGSYEIQREARLLDVMAQAGGPTTNADLRRVTLSRSGEAATRALDLQPVLAKGDAAGPELNLLVQPGDTIFIAATAEQIYVLGSVSKPGLYPIKRGDRVLDLLVTAGGAGAGASSAVLVRRDAKGQPVTKPLDLKKIMAKGDMAENEPLQPGDVLYVPDRKSHHSASEALGLLWPLTGLINLFR
jgi:polysaccharide export outer membrane protein